jgi:hypothetical protein
VNLFWASYVALWAVTVVLAIAVLVCLRQLGEMYLLAAGFRGVMGDGLDEGRTAPDLRVTLVDGGETTLSALLPRGGALVFAGELCRACEELVPRLLDLDTTLPVIVAYDRVPDDVRRRPHGGGVQLVELLDTDAPIRYRVRVTPFAFGLDETLRVRSRGLVNQPGHVVFHAGPTGAVLAGSAEMPVT